MNRADLDRLIQRFAFCLLALLSLLLFDGAALAGPAAQLLPKALLLSDRGPATAVPNAAYAPGGDALAAEPLHLTFTIRQTELALQPELAQPVCDGRPVEIGGSCRGGTDKRLFPGITLELFSFDDDTRLGSAQIGVMVAESESNLDKTSYWHVIPQYGRVWQEVSDGGWSRAAFPLMLVHDFENVAHQGLATFLYRGDRVSDVWLQFVQQSTPWNTPEHFVAWGRAESTARRIDDIDDLKRKRILAADELGERLDMLPWPVLEAQYPDGALDGFGGPLPGDWIAMLAAVKDSVVYYRESSTPFGPYPYPEEMRFGIRSATKSITVPLSLARLAQVYGPYVLNLKIGDYVDGLHPDYDDVRFIDAANMATGMGGSGSLSTVPNSGFGANVDDTYDDWYNSARSAAEKVAFITRDTGPYPWGPGVVFRYRDRDHHLLGMAVDRFLKSVRGADADIWQMIEEEVLRPIGIYHAPIIRTVEPDGAKGLPWFHAGYYPSVDDMAKIATLYQNRGRAGNQQLLHAGVTTEIFTPVGGLIKQYDHSLDAAFSRPTDPAEYTGQEVYKLGFQLLPYTHGDGTAGHAPTMLGHQGVLAILHANGMTSLRFAKAWPLPEDFAGDPYETDTIDIVNRLP
ncbi:MAG: hypothetical protein ACE5OQ_05165 [Woeseia sp.]